MSLPALLRCLDLHVDAQAIVLLERLVDELLRWNRRRNLTAITGHDEILEKHLVDSLTLLPFARRSKRLLDIGSGAGFPALPLKIACPGLEVVSVDAVGKKIDFQRHVARILGLKGFTALHQRVEQLGGDPASRAGFDLVTARAVCRVDELLAMAAPLLARDGRLVAMKGPEADRELDELGGSLAGAGWTIRLHRLTLPLSGAERCLVELSR